MTETKKSTSQTVERGPNRFRIALPLLLCGQMACLCLLRFGDIEFDHPGKLGLDFDDFVLICVVYGIVLIVGLACSIARKHWLVAVMQICIPIAVFAYNFRPVPRYDATQFQYLKGKSKSQVEGILGTRGAVTGLEGHPDGDHEFATYPGMTVKYSPQGRVTAVVPEAN